MSTSVAPGTSEAPADEAQRPAITPRVTSWRELATSRGALIAYAFIFPYVAFFLAFRIIPAL
ncbi:MAG: hypothetical protein ACTH1O_11905, partial [Brachybacterium sp.]